MGDDSEDAIIQRRDERGDYLATETAELVVTESDLVGEEGLTQEGRTVVGNNIIGRPHITALDIELLVGAFGIAFSFFSRNNPNPGHLIRSIYSRI